MARVVVTGGYGFIGSHLVTQLLSRGDTVTVFDVARTPHDTSIDFDEHARFRFVAGDVTDYTALEEVLTPDVDLVYHLAAVVGIKSYVENPLQVLDVNVTGTRHVLELSRRNGIRVLFSSTSEIYGKNPDTPFREDDDRILGSTRTARWSYSTSKAMAEHLCFAMHATYGLPVVVVRYFNVYGPRQNPIFVVSQSIQRVLNGIPPYLYDSGEQTRCFTHVDDAVRGTVLAAESDVATGQAYNIGGMRETSMKDVVERVLHHAGVQLEPERVDTGAMYGNRYEDIPRRIPDSSKAQQELGWSLDIDIDEGIRRTLAWARDNPWYLKLGNPGA